MTNHLKRALVLLAAATAASARYSCISSTTAPFSRDHYMAVFGTLDNNTIWAKEHIRDEDWVPERGFEMIQNDAYGCPSVTSYVAHQADIVYLGRSGNAHYKSYRYTRTSSEWYPSREESENIGGTFEQVSSAALKPQGSYKPDGLVVVGWDREDRSYRVKYRSQGQWYPSREEWEDLGGKFSDAPAVATNSRYAVVAGTEKSGVILLKLRALDKENALDEEEGPWTRWILIQPQDKDFVNSPILTSRERTEQSGRSDVFDLWAVNEGMQLIHIPLDIEELLRAQQPIEDQRNLGGKFMETPQVAYNGDGVYYLVGLSFEVDEDDSRYFLKGYNATEKSEDEGDWWPLAGPLSTEPSILTMAQTAGQKEADALYIYGIDLDNKVRLQVWDGEEILPSVDRGVNLGTLPKTNQDRKSGRRPLTQQTLEL